jgi:hypothetical protein
MNEVDKYLKDLEHPLKTLVLKVRETILHAHEGLEENIKWNAPNFMYEGVDRITMKLYPPRQVQVVLHRGTGKKPPLEKHLIGEDKGLLTWAANDRAVASFKDLKDLERRKDDLVYVIALWLEAE